MISGFYDVFVPKEKTLGAKSGHKVVAEITEWPENVGILPERLWRYLGIRMNPVLIY